MYKLIAVDRLGSGVWVSASFQILTLEVGEISEVGTAIFQAGEMSEGMSEGGMSYTLTWRPTIMVNEQWQFYGCTFKSLAPSCLQMTFGHPILPSLRTHYK